MFSIRKLLFILIVPLLFAGCERPSSPDFTFQHSVQVPIIANRTVEFIGGANALIDTTSTDFEDLFSIDGDGLVRVVTEIDFNIGDFDDMFPELVVNPTEVVAEIGLIEVAFTGRGSTTYENITGVPSSAAPAPGAPMTAGQSPEIDIELDVSDFKHGIIESGGITVRFTNQLGFDISELEATLFTEGTSVSGPEQIMDIAAGEQKALTFLFQTGDQISVPLIIRIQLEWQNQTVTSEPDDLRVSAFDEDLLAQNVTAVIRSQDFFSNGTIDIDDEEFRFEKQSHYVEVEEGVIILDQIINRIDLDIDPLIISFPDIFMPPFNTADTLVITLSGSDRIRRMETRTTPGETSLDGYRIKALDNIIRYNLNGLTEDSRDHVPADSFRTIDASEYVEASILLSDLRFNEVFGVVQPKSILLNEDDGNDNRLDLFNPVEAEITELDDLEFLSQRVNNITFYSPNLNLLYRSNIGVPSRVYAAILGVNADGHETFLRPDGAGSEYHWTASDTIQGFALRGSDIQREDLIAFDVAPSENPYADPVSRVITFNDDNSNIGEFISNLPVEIRFIGKTIANSDREDGLVVDPIIFETSLDLDMPLNFGTETPGSYQDTLDADLGFLPDESSDTRVTRAIVSIMYENRLPLELGINLEFLDEWDAVISVLPVTEEQSSLLKLNAAPIDAQTRFTSGASNGLLQLELDDDQLEILYQTRKIRVSGDFLTAVKEASSEVKIRFDDYFKFSLGIDVSVNTRVN